MNVVSIALVDDQPIALAGLVHVFAGEGEYHVIATGAGLQEAMRIAKEHQPDVLVLDLGASGHTLTTITSLVAQYPATRILAFAAASGVEHAVSALEAGARAYVAKSCSVDELLRAVRAVMAGETYVSQSLASSLIMAFRQTSERQQVAQEVTLTAREEQIVQLLLLGKPNKEIAARLRVKEKTVKHYMTILMQKLSVTNRVEAVIAAQKLNMKPRSADLHIHTNDSTLH